MDPTVVYSVLQEMESGVSNPDLYPEGRRECVTLKHGSSDTYGFIRSP